MRDMALLRLTLTAMRCFGNDRARWQDGGRGACGWHAGPQPLNGQAIQDLVADGWLRKSSAGDEVWVDAWPSFASSMHPLADMAGNLSAETWARRDRQLAECRLRIPAADGAAQIAGGNTPPDETRPVFHPKL